MKRLFTAVMLMSSFAFAGPTDKTTPAKWQGGDEERGPGSEHFEDIARKMHMMAVVGIAEALELTDADALKLSEKLKGFEDRRRPVREAMGEAMKALKATAEGDTSSAAQVDANIAKVLDGRSQMAALDKELFATLSQGQTAQKKAKLALFMAHFGQEMQHFKGGKGRFGGH